MSSTLVDVARTDFLSVRRSKLVLGVGALYSLFALLIVYGTTVGPSRGSVDELLALMSVVGVLVIPLVALVSAYLAVAGERESGRVRYLLGLPTTRFDVVAAKFLSRSAVVGGAVTVAFLVGGALAVALYPTFDAPMYVSVVALTLVFAITYVAIAVGISAATASRSRAMGAAIGHFFVFNVLWVLGGTISITGIVRFLFEDTLGMELARSTELFIKALSPATAYVFSLGLVLPQFEPPVPKGGAPVYLEPWFMLVILAVWAFVPLAVGYRRFARADLG